ncbi:ABC transporter ATP-binding protein [Bdellovibrio sp. 22V]|uniref:ATP-binding cassette domain-containing protein n=1 Tax=Bdellovibrio sp. 22V TaxID=3044166 RepID=UPI0025427C75|nr:ABC transporter ATP-binding protein [Bdellovibrio sp. 22V]WII71974.1 ABC transporter ATP-binding protein [Bdellovibrio sp. 22V]
MNCYEITDLVVKYPFQDRPALDSLSLQIRSGSFTVVLGANGSGKSTLLKCLAGTQMWHSGTLFLNGITRSLDLPKFNADQIHISEDIVLPNFSISNLVSLYQKFWPKFNIQMCEHILSLGSISLIKRPSQLSRGQKILLQFALGLATRSTIVLVDEVTAALDPYVRKKVIEELSRYQQEQGATIVLATNIASEVEEVDLDIILLKSGRVLMAGRASDIKKQFRENVKKLGESELVTVEEIFAHFSGQGRE